MKPHHAAAKWSFADFQSPTYSAIMMEYTTPPSYGSTVVNVGGIVKDGEIIYAGVTNTAEHTESKEDKETEWPEPKAVKFTWRGKTKGGEDVSAELAGSLGERLDKVDVMAKVPGFVKTLVGGLVGTKPYIYQVRLAPSFHRASKSCLPPWLTCVTQYSPQQNLALKIKIGNEEKVEEGQLFSEATFIC